uniref:DNA binding protein n=1 Tax=Rhizophora mucronata TaxID=61149 RepID=A0A2P2LAU9_RHIMU
MSKTQLPNIQRLLFIERRNNHIIIISSGIMSQCIVPSWKLRHQRQEQVEEEERNRSSHVHNQLQNPITTPLFPMSNCEVAELTWENGQVAMHGLGGLIHSVPTKPTWTWAGRTSETLESIVHQATSHKQNLNNTHQPQLDHARKSSAASKSSNINVTSSTRKWPGTSAGHRVEMVPLSAKRGPASESTGVATIVLDGSSHHQDPEHVNISACASASANGTFCRDNDTATMTWASLESTRSMKSKTTEDDSTFHTGSENQEEDRETKTETPRSHSSRRFRAAATHNQSERKRRHRINQKMKALQKLVPNARKTDKASMLDEVIEYLKQLQAHVQMLSTVRNMMVAPLGMQQFPHQMSLLAPMAMATGMGIGMLDMSTVARGARPPQTLSPFIRPTPTSMAAATPAFVHPPFLVPPMIPTAGPLVRANPDPVGSNASVHMPDPYYAFLPQVCDTSK